MYGLCFRWPGGCVSQAVHQTHHGAVLKQPTWLFSGVWCEYGLCSWSVWECVCMCSVHVPVLPVAQRHRWLWEKDLIKEESLIKITPLAGGIYAGMQGSLSLVHAHSKHHNPIWTHPKARTGSPEEDLLKDFDAYQYQRCSRYQFVTEVLCFTDIERQKSARQINVCFITAHWGANYYAAV